MRFHVCADEYGTFTVVEDGQPIPHGMKSVLIEAEHKFHALGKALYIVIVALEFLAANGDEEAMNKISDDLDAVVSSLMTEMRWDK